MLAISGKNGKELVLSQKEYDDLQVRIAKALGKEGPFSIRGIKIAMEVVEGGEGGEGGDVQDPQPTDPARDQLKGRIQRRRTLNMIKHDLGQRFHSINPENFFIAPDRAGHGWCLYVEGDYNDQTVLEGNYAINPIDDFETKEEGMSKYPGIDVQEAAPSKMESHMSPSPPKWFDPSNAGEVWSEEDY